MGLWRSCSPMDIQTRENVSDLPSHASRRFGYARVRTDDQDLSLQIDALLGQGIPRTAIYTDKVSGAKTERPGLSNCLRTLRRGDRLVVWRVDGLGRSMGHLIALVDELRRKGIGLRSLNEGAMDTSSASGELIFNIFSALAQFERRLTQERTKAGLAAARARGPYGGRPRITSGKAKVVLAKKLKPVCETGTSSVALMMNSMGSIPSP